MSLKGNSPINKRISIKVFNVNTIYKKKSIFKLKQSRKKNKIGLEAAISL